MNGLPGCIPAHQVQVLIEISSLEETLTLTSEKVCSCRSGWNGGEDVHGEGAPSFQPRLHPDLLDASSRVREPCRELREIHPAVVSQVLLLSFSGVWVGLMFFYPFHENSGIPHPPHWILQRRFATWR